MSVEFKELNLFINETLLKEYLINGFVFASEKSMNAPSLSDNCYGGILAFNKDISIKDLKEKCCLNNYENAVVLKVLINKNQKVDAFINNEKITNCVVSDFSDADCYFLKECISFCNVTNILPVEKAIVFLQGDTTLKIPYNLLSNDFYCPKDYLGTEKIQCILSYINEKFIHSFDNLVTKDIEDVDFTNISSEHENIERAKNGDCFSLSSKLLASLLMLIQGNCPLNNCLTSDAYCILKEESTFDDFVKTNIYKDSPFNISNLIEKPNLKTLDFYDVLKKYANKNSSCKSLYYYAIDSLFKLQNNDRDEFKDLFLTQIDDDKKNYFNECFFDQRARSRLSILKNNSDDFLPIYFLYVFFDYGFDRLNDNIIEFELDKSPYVNVILALWAFKNGMKSIYEEFKNNEIIYACSYKIFEWLKAKNELISFELFNQINSINFSFNQFNVGNYRCSYTNILIEYNYCAFKRNLKIKDILSTLQKELINTFDFEYKILKKDILNYYDDKLDLLQFKEQIHKKYLLLFKNKSNKTKNDKKNLKQPNRTVPLFKFEELGGTNND